MADDPLSRIREQYPQLAWLINDPEIGPLLREAVDPNKGFSPQTFQARLYNTNWFKKKSQATREWTILSHTDPGEANARRSEYRTEIVRLSSSLGIPLSPQEAQYITEAALQSGWDLSGGQLREAIAAFGRKKNKYGPGAIMTTAAAAKEMAAGQYYVSMSHTDAVHWADWIARGLRTEDDLKVELSNRAKSKYSYLSQELGTGKTMEEIFAGHRATIADELEISPASIDFTKGQWAKVLGVRDPTTGQTRPMSLYETQTLARQDNRWWSTSNGKEADAGMANFVLKMFGKRAT